MKTRSVSPDFPSSAAYKGRQGFVVVEFSVEKDGTVRSPIVVEAVPRNEFEVPSLRAIRKWQFEPAMLDGKVVRQEPYTVTMQFLFASDSESAMNQNQDTGSHIAKKPMKTETVFGRKFGVKFYEQARDGEPFSQYMFALIAEDAGMETKGESSLSWMLSAAQFGLPEAQYHLGSALFRGDKCLQDKAKAMHWMRLSAEQGFLPAMYFLGRELNKQNDAQGALAWWRKAAAKGFATASRDAAWLMATSSVQELRNGDTAVALAESAADSLKADPHALEALAAAYAESGKFAKAAKLQQDAIDDAADYAWATDTMSQRLASYQAGKPWRE